jgi:hypothetical protein
LTKAELWFILVVSAGLIEMLSKASPQPFDRYIAVDALLVAVSKFMR